jgi:hypothetical protein
VIPPGAHGAGFGVLTSASLVGMASSPFFAGFLGGASLRIVFFADLALMALLAAAGRSPDEGRALACRGWGLGAGGWMLVAGGWLLADSWRPGDGCRQARTAPAD